MQTGGVEVRYFKINSDWLPDDLTLTNDEWIYFVDYYGQLTDSQISDLQKKYHRVILDATMSYFREPLPGIDTVYSCRKFFGVADGGILFTDAKLDRELTQDESFERMYYVMGRFERTASEFYNECVTENEKFRTEPVKKMSRLTENILHGIDYDFVRERRRRNFEILHEELGKINPLKFQRRTTWN